MKFVISTSLTDEAKAAIAKGNGKHGKFAVDGNGKYITLLDSNGRTGEWITIVEPFGDPIEEIV